MQQEFNQAKHGAVVVVTWTQSTRPWMNQDHLASGYGSQDKPPPKVFPT